MSVLSVLPGGIGRFGHTTSCQGLVSCPARDTLCVGMWPGVHAGAREKQASSSLLPKDLLCPVALPIPPGQEVPAALLEGSWGLAGGQGCPELSLQERLSPNEISPEFLSQVVNSTALSDAACNVQGWPVLRGGLRCHPYRVSALRRRRWGTLVLSSAWGRGGEGNGAASGAFVLGRLVTTARSKVWERGRVRSTPRCLHWGGVKQNSGDDPSSQLVPP